MRTRRSVPHVKSGPRCEARVEHMQSRDSVGRRAGSCRLMLPRARGGTYAAAVAVAAGINSLTMPIYSRSPDGHIMGADGKPEWGRPKFVNTRRRGAMPPLRVAFPSGWAEDALEVHCWRDARFPVRLLSRGNSRPAQQRHTGPTGPARRRQFLPLKPLSVTACCVAIEGVLRLV